MGSFRGVLRSMPMTAFTTLANVTGYPAISVPAARSSGGLPIGVQLSTFRHDERVLVALAHQWESRAAAQAGIRVSESAQ
ncbi:MAG: amidase family protein [Propioniciclava sp.]